MRHTAKIICLACLTMLGACAHETKQEVLRQTILNADSSYQLASMALIPILEGKIPGIQLTDTQKENLKHVANLLGEELVNATNQIKAGNPISEIVADTIKIGVNGYVKCLTQLKEKVATESCSIIRGSSNGN